MMSGRIGAVVGSNLIGVFLYGHCEYVFGVCTSMLLGEWNLLFTIIHVIFIFIFKPIIQHPLAYASMCCIKKSAKCYQIVNPFNDIIKPRTTHKCKRLVLFVNI